MEFRRLTQDDADAVVQFVLMAAFPPGREPPADAMQMPHVRRWLDDWGDELGVGWEEDGELVGAAWARKVEPVVVRDAATGQQLPEVVVSLTDRRRGEGWGRYLMEGVKLFADIQGAPGLCLTVSEHNPAAVRLYEKTGFVTRDRTETGLLVMVWTPRSRR
jgi:GNAT superfamily N-acetyltransferase